MSKQQAAQRYSGRESSSTNRAPDVLAIPDYFLENWQDLVDTLAKIVGVPSASITRIVGDDIEMFVSSRTLGNPYRGGNKEHLFGSGSYNETVIRNRAELLVQNAHADSDWKNNPDVKLNMISFLGIPILWPDMRPFGTIYISDCKENLYSEEHRKLIGQFRNQIEAHLELIDLRQKVAAGEALRKAKEKAEKDDRAKSKFLAIMSHEVRIPISGVLGFAELLSETDLNPEQSEYVRTITSSGEALLKLIEDFLDFSSIEAGRMKIETFPLSIGDVIRSITTLLKPKANQKGIALLAEIDPAVPKKVLGDSGRLRQILINLIGNALKFTEKGHVLIRIRSLPAIDQYPFDRIEFSVEDTGLGMSPAQLNQIFLPFTQADASIARRYGGSGLGLAITEQIVTLMQGRIQATSQLGKGSQFTFEIPFNRAPSEPVSAALPASTVSRE
jgi:two-component system sensor histidine kinase/response regulator